MYNSQDNVQTKKVSKANTNTARKRVHNMKKDSHIPIQQQRAKLNNLRKHAQNL